MLFNKISKFSYVFIFLGIPRQARYIVLFAILILSGCQSGTSTWTSEDYRKASTALYNQELYDAAVVMYERYLHSSTIPKDDIPKVLYQIGNIYLDNLNDPKKALESYTLLQTLYPEQTFDNQVGKKMVMCLEKTGRNTDAKYALNAMTELGASSGTLDTERSRSAQSDRTQDGGTIVAEVEGRKVTLREVEIALGRLPESALEKNQVISQYVAQILIADAAKRKGIDNNPEYKKRLEFVSNQLLAQASLQEELKLSPPSANDLKYYFEANKARFQTGEDSGKTMEQLQNKIGQAWAQEKQQEKYQAYVQKLLASDKVTIYGTTGRKN